MNKDPGDCLAGLSPLRRERVEAIGQAFLDAADGVTVTTRYRMPSYEKGPNRAAVGSQKNYLSVYFCSEGVIDNIRMKHPRLSTGKGCVRIRDSREAPLGDLVVSFRRAMNFKKPVAAERGREVK